MTQPDYLLIMAKLLAQAGNAEVVKLVDALASGASRGNPVEVQVLSSAPLISVKSIAYDIDDVILM